MGLGTPLYLITTQFKEWRLKKSVIVSKEKPFTWGGKLRRFNQIIIRIRLNIVMKLAVGVAVSVLVINSVTFGYRDMDTLTKNIYLEEIVHLQEDVSLEEYFLSVIDALAECIEDAVEDWQKLRKDQRSRRSRFMPIYPRPAPTEWDALGGIYSRLLHLPYWPRAPPATGGVRGPLS